ncbi:tRNA 2-thiouridine(34) synthase MnmA [Frateuria aurantia]|uniref:tRNA-specific 2-thiouridylase MnmA n=1 Tax=Frateuria aurantia (strain ATCC 33424 / DSM 6220 / KCTC 2777 / LMG 1558 / NBRC 3245 / NCIMB 13370) TaxID=767434 RepID=H8L4G9_FRAAD|nr:tRNA 2-thiouridine(34) synthase MnmA [Frateuria aurantia]AFC85643.1 tRNA (5-methylaminomethyl-2-thiouridylate)-methyltransferase [Frateuria aurantia DSM 6220]
MKVMLGVSGGVDSSVAALLLQREGREVEGLFMQNWEEDIEDGPCTVDTDRKDALSVCGRLGIPFHARNFAADYWQHVFEHFIAEYRAGRTPNPDILCNREIKFKTFLTEARALGAEQIATGHYARVARRDGRWQLLKAVDASKDQSYFLHALGQDALSATLFPLGEIEKSSVRELAREAALPTHAKKDSTGICFIGERNFRDFLGRYLPAQPGEIWSVDGQCLGPHQGTMYYTLGQRNGLGIGGRQGASGEPWYVVGKDLPRNRLLVAQGGENQWLHASRIRAVDATWIDGRPPSGQFRCAAKTRYRQPDQACEVTVGSDHLEIRFDDAQRAPTPGQSVVFYDGEVCLGGAVITATDAAFGGWSEPVAVPTPAWISPSV